MRLWDGGRKAGAHASGTVFVLGSLQIRLHAEEGICVVDILATMKRERELPKHGDKLQKTICFIEKFLVVSNQSMPFWKWTHL